MARTRDIQTNQEDVACDVCGRTLLRGERAEPYLAGGTRRQVCDLCQPRARHEGWIRESGAGEVAVRSNRHDGRGRSLVERLRARRERAREAAAAPEPPPAPQANGAGPAPETGEYQAAPRSNGAQRTVVEPPPRRPRHVRAVPTNNELKMQRAVELFNASDHTRTVGGVARSLGAPAVCVRTLDARPAVVRITVMWELSWYRYEIDLSDESGGVRREAHGDELDELAPEEQLVNAAADDRGGLHLAAGGAA